MNPFYFVSDQLTMWSRVFVIFRLNNIWNFFKKFNQNYEIYEIFTKLLTIKDFRFKKESFSEFLLQSSKKESADRLIGTK